MKLKYVFIFLISFCIVSTIALYSYVSLFKPLKSSFCPFCDEKVINYQKYFEDEYLIGLCSYKPLLRGHCLIIPKRHVERLENLTDSEVQGIFNLIKKTHFSVQKILDSKAYIIIQKNGEEVGQTVSHLHFHYIPRKENSSNFAFLLKFLIYPFKTKLNSNEMQDITSLISQNI